MKTIFKFFLNGFSRCLIYQIYCLICKKFIYYSVLRIPSFNKIVVCKATIKLLVLATLQAFPPRRLIFVTTLSCCYLILESFTLIYHLGHVTILYNTHLCYILNISLLQPVKAMK